MSDPGPLHEKASKGPPYCSIGRNLSPNTGYPVIEALKGGKVPVHPVVPRARNADNFNAESRDANRTCGGFPPSPPPFFL